MTRPKSVRIGPLTYDIRWVEQIDSDLANVHGKCWPDRQVILLNRDAPPDRIATSFMHEIGHAMTDLWNCYTKITPEQACDVVGDGIAMFAQDNPEAWEWWLGLIAGK